MDEASLCDRVALMQNGRMLAIRPPQEIVDGYPYELLSVRSADIYRLLEDLHGYPGAIHVFAFGQTAHLSCRPGSIEMTALADYLAGKGHTRIAIEPIRAGIEDCFMNLMETP
jgi:ABC-type multidrug transport system ATPase subunit